MKKAFSIESAIAANRFGMGARPGDLETIDKDPKAWLLAQVAGPAKVPGVLAALDDSGTILAEVDRVRELRNQKRKQGLVEEPGVKEYGKTVRNFYMQQVAARYISAATTDYPFYERLVHFWSNHFAVSADKQPIPAVAGSFENEAIRPNLSGNFKDLLIAAEKHPAMIMYLDNQRSVGPGSKLGKKAGKRSKKKKVGLNENLAREILELHTLGVDGGYSQTDVMEFAKALTGWSVGSSRGRRPAGIPGRFYFRSEIHEPGTVNILNYSYSDDGVSQAEAILANLAEHKSTARHIATKLARHFVCDEPPVSLVDSLTENFLKTGGDLSALHTTLIESKEAWNPESKKLKTPEDFLMSTFRAFKYRPDKIRNVFAALEMMGQTTYQPGSPAGWPDTADHWGGADSLYKRIEWSNGVSQKIGRRSNPVELGEQILGPSLAEHSRLAISRAESLQQGLVLLLVSPEFQRR